MVVGGLACAGGTWGYRVTARRTPAMATERLGRLHLSTLPLLYGDMERVPRVPPLAPRGNGKATTYRAPLATPGVGVGLTAATISSAVRGILALRDQAGAQVGFSAHSGSCSKLGSPTAATLPAPFALPAGASACGSHTARHVTPSAARNTGSGAGP